MDTTIFLQNLNADSSTIRAALQPMTDIASANAMFRLLFVVIFFGILAFLISKVFLTPKTKEYRKILSDMFVTGKVRKLAIKEGIDLANEFKTFKKWEKKGRMIGKDVDDTVEIILRDKITGEAESEIDNLEQ